MLLAGKTFWLGQSLPIHIMIFHGHIDLLMRFFWLFGSVPYICFKKVNYTMIFQVLIYGAFLALGQFLTFAKKVNYIMIFQVLIYGAFLALGQFLTVTIATKKP